MGDMLYPQNHICRGTQPTHMAEVTIENPEIHKTNKVDADGRVYVGTAVAGKRVNVIVEVVDNND